MFYRYNSELSIDISGWNRFYIKITDKKKVLHLKNMSSEQVPVNISHQIKLNSSEYKLLF